MTPEEFLEARIADFERDYDSNRIYPWTDGWKYLSMLRAMLEQHKNWPMLVSTEPELKFEMLEPDQLVYSMTQKFEWTTRQEYVARFGDQPATSTVLRSWLMVWQDHPDFNPEWLV